MSSHALLALGFFLGIVLTLVVAIDANNRGRSALAWGTLTFFTGLVGALIYVVVVLAGSDSTDADEDPDTVRLCPNCSTSHTGTPNYCSECGDPLDEDDDRAVATIFRSGSQGYCGNCKSKVDLDADSCPSCGAIL